MSRFGGLVNIWSGFRKSERWCNVILGMYKCKQRWHYNFKISILFYSIRSAGAIMLQELCPLALHLRDMLAPGGEKHVSGRPRKDRACRSFPWPAGLLSLSVTASPDALAPAGNAAPTTPYPWPSPLSPQAGTREPRRGQAHPVHRILGALRAPLIAPHSSAPSQPPRTLYLWNMKYLDATYD
jgi:hypothetical protein